MIKEIIIYKNKHFRIISNNFTPRPHLILLNNDQHKSKDDRYRNIYDFPYIVWKNWILTLKKTFKHFGPCIFSIHLGFFQSKKSPHFHAHYYLPTNYSPKLEKWKNRILSDGATYKKHDLANISKINSSHKSFDKPLPNLTKNYSILFHHDQPRIYFIHNQHGPNHRSLYDLIWTMMEFIHYYELDDRSKGGCHLCLQNNLYIDEISKKYEIKGYLQIDIVNYYLIYPERKKWLQNFKKTDYFVLT